jgi:hypothetical protein
MPRSRPQPVSPKAIFAHAETFFSALSQLHEVHQHKMTGIIAPAMVIAAFTSELYLKSFICRETTSAPKGHHLHNLYTLLLSDTKVAIERHWNAITRDHEEFLNSIDRQEPRPLPRNLEDALKEGSRAFEQLRYIYEGADPFRFVLGDLPLVIRRTLLDLEPSWAKQDGIPIGLSYPAALEVGVRKEGSVAFWVNAPNGGWANDENQYNFGPTIRAEGIDMAVFKTPDRRISLTIGGPLGRTFRFNHPIPPITSPRGLHIAVTWMTTAIILYLNGKPAITVDPMLTS